MRGLLLSVAALGLVACGGDDGTGGVDQCANVVPPPAACMTECDPSPGAATTCPGGYHCTPDATCNAFCTQGGTECGDGYRCTPDGRCVGEDECIGLECNIVDCAAMGMPDTTISGTVFAPNGTLPLYNVNVYVPNAAVADPVEGVVCDKCSDSLPGFPLSKVTTDEAGKFTLTGVPSGQNVPIVIQTGKWRRTITIPMVNQCADTALAMNDTRLPKNKSEGNIPKIAVTTGNADSLECLIRKLGIEDAEITANTGTGRVNLYHGNGTDEFNGGAAIPEAEPFWSSQANLDAYDIVFLSCEGSQNPDEKPQAALDAMKGYADKGGRVFASHWHNIWIEGSTEGGGNQAPAVWPSIAQWNNDNTTFTTPSDMVDTANNPKGASFSTWLTNVGASPAGMPGVIPIQNNTGKNTIDSVDRTKAEEWVYWPQNNNTRKPQMLQFTTPNESAERCGKVVFTDMHVSGGPGNGSYPSSCNGAGTTLSPQEKALAFMFFDIAACVQPPIL